MTNLTFCSLSSGSSGNCYYVGNGSRGILIDAGISATSIRRFLREKEISMESIMGVLVTHNHSDHIKGLEVLLRKNHLPAFTTRRVWDSILDDDSKISSDCIREIQLFRNFRIDDFDIEAFPVCHDSPETLGFRIGSGNSSMTIATDLGHICNTSAEYIIKSNLLVLESNYDEEMLMSGAYPLFLKNRIRSDSGHLSNHQISTFLAKAINGNHKTICLAHLSKNNNTPEKALETLYGVFSDSGIRLNGTPGIIVLNRNNPSELINIT